MPELLLEILSEEIPARMQPRAAEDLKRLICDDLKAERLLFTNARSFATPRRLTLVVEGVPEHQPDFKKETKGPAIDAPEKAINGFLGSVGLTLDQCEKREVKGKEFWFAVVEEKGQPIQDVLHGVLYRAIWNFPWPKSMRWSDLDLAWARPIHGIVAVFNGQQMSTLSIPTRKTGAPSGPDSITPSNQTVGHRFMAP
ncbi:MAG TPA: glycine--tRNA ligase subunit beta, partial [Alphaproteobacteria bacterium]